MSILKFVYQTPRDLERMYIYMINPLKTTEDGIFAIGCNPKSPVTEMQFVQDIHHRNHIAHPYLQVIFVFDFGLKMPLRLLKEISVEIGKALLLDKRQLFGAIHYLGKESNHISCHYLINTIGIDGSVYRQKYPLSYYKNKINEILAKYGLNPIVMQSY